MASTTIVKELDIETLVPNVESMKTDKGGTKICIIGKPGTGKSILIKDIIYSKKDIIPVGIVISGSEDSNKFYETFFPKLFIYEKYNKDIIERFIERQKIAKDKFDETLNPWGLLVMDDCMDDVKIFNDPLMIGLFKNSRHWAMMSIFACQYVFDFKPVIRSNIDGTFIFREPNIITREKIWKNFASIIPTFKLFNQLMDEITNDYTCLYVDNFTQSNDWHDCVYYYKAKKRPDFDFGCPDYWKFAQTREHADPDSSL